VTRVLACAGDAGGAEAIAPVITELRSRAGVEVEAWAYGPAIGIFERAGLQPVAVARDTSPFPSRTIGRADAILLATSVAGDEHEKALAAAAREAGVPSVAVLDYWSAYGDRFGVVPDRVAVIDERMAEGLAAAGVPADRIVVCGAPQHDALAELAPLDPARRAALRAQAGAGPGDRLVLFASQPLRAQYGDALGYDEATVLEALGAALASVPRPVRLVVRPHPREPDPARLPAGAVLVRDGERLDWVRAADLVCGMTTALLLEAALLRCVTLSLQPGLAGVDTLRVAVPVTDPQEVEPTVHRALLDDTYRAALIAAAPPTVPGAACRVADLVLATAGVRW
jgi:hypothetical protein